MRWWLLCILILAISQFIPIQAYFHDDEGTVLQRGSLNLSTDSSAEISLNLNVSEFFSSLGFRLEIKYGNSTYDDTTDLYTKLTITTNYNQVQQVRVEPATDYTNPGFYFINYDFKQYSNNYRGSLMFSITSEISTSIDYRVSRVQQTVTSRNIGNFVVSAANGDYICCSDTPANNYYGAGAVLKFWIYSPLEGLALNSSATLQQFNMTTGEPIERVEGLYQLKTSHLNYFRITTQEQEIDDDDHFPWREMIHIYVHNDTKVDPDQVTYFSIVFNLGSTNPNYQDIAFFTVTDVLWLFPLFVLVVMRKRKKQFSE